MHVNKHNNQNINEIFEIRKLPVKLAIYCQCGAVLLILIFMTIISVIHTCLDNEGNMRPVCFILLSFSSFILSSSELQRNNSCEIKDLSEAMFVGDIIVKAKLKKIEQSGVHTTLKLSISKIYKDSTSENLPKRLHVESCVNNLENNKKYIFVLKNFSNLVFQLIAKPSKPSKKVSRLIRNIICDKCGQGPSIKPLPNHLSVKIYR